MVGDDGDLTAMRRDFDTVNDVLAETVPIVLRDLGRVSRWVNIAAARGGGRLFDFSLATARKQAWATAVRLHPLSAEERARERQRRSTGSSGVLAYMVANPQLPVSLLVGVARLLEERDARG